MSSIWLFGDSFTEGFNTYYPWAEQYIKWKGYTPKVYGEVLSEKLNLELKNFGKGGSDNYTIFQKFCDVSDLIQPNDLVIFGWSSPIRFRLLRSNGDWESLVPNFKSNYNLIDGVSPASIREILVHRDHDKFIDEVNSWIKLITLFLKNNNVTIIHWTTFDTRINAKYVFHVNKISTETDGLVNDGHFSEAGHLELSNILLNLYHNQNNNII